MNRFSELKSLDAARLEIDRIDDAMLDLLHERALVVKEVARLKAEEAARIDELVPRIAFRPARELAMLRRFAEKCAPYLNFALVYAVWREIVGGFTAMQAPLRIAALPSTQALARNTFGAAAGVTETSNAAAVFEQIGAGAVDLGILPASDLSWMKHYPDENIQIVCALPFYGNEIIGYAISRSAPEQSGDDVTLAIHEGKLIAETGFMFDDTGAAMAERLALSPESLRVIGAYPRPVPKVMQSND